MNDIRIGVVGVGHLGSLHAKMIREISGAQLAGVHDRDSERGRAISAEYGTRFYEDLEALINDVDGITVATTTSSHFEVASRVIARGKHLFIEKPITETSAQAGILCDRARENNVLIQVGHIERFNPAILALDPYEIRPLFVESHRLAQFNPRGTDVAVVLDLMIHDIDLILSFVRSPVKAVEANGVAVVSESVDIANARLQFENGCVANVTASRISQRKMRKMRLFQPNAYISIDFSEGVSEVFRLVGEHEPEAKGTLMLGELGSGSRKRKIVYEQPEVKEVNALKHELGLFVESVRTGKAPIVGGEDGKHALEIAGVIMDKIGQQVIPML